MAADRTTTVKRSIKPVTITVTLSASRINENGTFSGFTVQKITGPNKTAKAVCPPMGGGSIYLKVDSLEGLELLTTADTSSPTATAKVKLF
jgi:hypothetical protein